MPSAQRRAFEQVSVRTAAVISGGLLPKDKEVIMETMTHENVQYVHIKKTQVGSLKLPPVEITGTPTSRRLNS